MQTAASGALAAVAGRAGNRAERHTRNARPLQRSQVTALVAAAVLVAAATLVVAGVARGGRGLNGSGWQRLRGQPHTSEVNRPQALSVNPNVKH